MRVRARGQEADKAQRNLAQGREESISTLGGDVLYWITEIILLTYRSTDQGNIGEGIHFHEK